jgi:hypothetical protein
MDNYKIIGNIEEYIDDIIKLDDDFYDTDYIWANEYQLDVYKRNKDSFIAIELNGKLIGYLNYLCIKDSTYNKIIESNITIDDFELNEIVEYQEGDNYITINSIVIKKEYQDTNIIKYLTDGLLSKLKMLEENNKHIAGINGIAISEDGIKFFKNLGFTNVKLLKDNNSLFYLDKDVVKTIEDSINKLKINNL